MSEPPTQRPAPEAYPPQAYPPQNQPPQNQPPQNQPPQNYLPQHYPAQNYPPQNYPQPSPPLPRNPQTYPPNPTAPYPVQPQYRAVPRKPSEELRKDSEAALAARMELGAEYNEYVAAGLAERVEELAAAHAAELRQQAELANREEAAERSGRARQTALAIVSVIVGIPITGIAATQVDPSVVGVAVSWAGIVGVNWVHARSLRKRK
jgi:hypothetical protein